MHPPKKGVEFSCSAGGCPCTSSITGCHTYMCVCDAFSFCRLIDIFESLQTENSWCVYLEG